MARGAQNDSTASAGSDDACLLPTAMCLRADSQLLPDTAASQPCRVDAVSMDPLHDWRWYMFMGGALILAAIARI